MIDRAIRLVFILGHADGQLFLGASRRKVMLFDEVFRHRPANQRGQNQPQGRNGYPAERLGELIHTALTTPRPKVRYAAVKGRLVEKLFMRLATKRMLDRMIGKTLGLLER